MTFFSKATDAQWKVFYSAAKSRRYWQKKHPALKFAGKSKSDAKVIRKLQICTAAATNNPEKQPKISARCLATNVVHALEQMKNAITLIFLFFFFFIFKLFHHSILSNHTSLNHVHQQCKSSIIFKQEAVNSYQPCSVLLKQQFTIISTD